MKRCFCVSIQAFKQMKQLYDQGFTLVEIAEQFDVSSATVSSLFREQHVTMRQSADYRRGKTRKQYQREIAQRQLGGI